MRLISREGCCLWARIGSRQLAPCLQLFQAGTHPARGLVIVQDKERRAEQPSFSSTERCRHSRSDPRRARWRHPSPPDNSLQSENNLLRGHTQRMEQSTGSDPVLLVLPAPSLGGKLHLCRSFEGHPCSNCSPTPTFLRPKTAVSATCSLPVIVSPGWAQKSTISAP